MMSNVLVVHVMMTLWFTLHHRDGKAYVTTIPIPGVESYGMRKDIFDTALNDFQIKIV